MADIEQNHKEAIADCANVEDEDEEEEEEDEEEAPVQLGFFDIPETSFLLHRNANWSSWDGGKAGGKPIWLNPLQLPNKEDLLCVHCKAPLVFLLQIYAPLDQPIDAFHRAIYIFICGGSGCSDLHSAKVFRCQIPRRNPFYPFESVQQDEPIHFSKEYSTSLCSFCGCRANKTCSRCRQALYCSREHQRMDWKDSHSKNCKEESKTSTDQLQEAIVSESNRYRFAEFEITIEEEPNREERSKMEDWTHENQILESYQEEERKREELKIPEGFDEAKISQKDIKDMLGARALVDLQTVRFQNRISTSKDQCIRYCRDPKVKPLWFSSENQIEKEQVPPCSSCGGPRIFELQVMPQALYYFGVNWIDWGSLVVYTCENSCSISQMDSCESVQPGEISSYVEEFIWWQSARTTQDDAIKQESLCNN